MWVYLGLEYFWDTSKRVYILYLLSALFLSYIFMKKSVSIQFSKEVLLHPSAKLDYLYYLSISFIKICLLIPLLFSVDDVVLWVLLELEESLGYQERVKASKLFILLSYSLIVFILNDLSRYLLHRAMHYFGFLWRFHRLHHSAEVLNPLSFYRVHPLENLLFGLRYALVTGLTMGMFVYYFGAGIHAIELFGLHIFSFIFMLLGANLRHSHIPLRFGTGIEKWILSPFQHQLHHSKKHLQSNFGSTLAIWDRIFNTLSIKKIEILEFGLPHEKVKHSLVFALFSSFYKKK